MRIYKNKYIFCVFLALIILSSGQVFFPINNSSFEPISEWNERLNLSDNELVINTPENITYTAPMRGYYPATIGFENDINGAKPEGFSSSDDPGCTSMVIDEFEGHKKVVKLIDQNDAENDASARLYYDVNIDQHDMEFWIYPDTESICSIQLFGDGLIVNLQFDGRYDKIRYYDPYNYYYLNFIYTEQWYHIRFDIDYENDIYDIFIDGTKYIDNGLFPSPADELHFIKIRTWEFTVGEFYIDAIGLSEYPDYDIGDNLHEGLLLGFDNTTNLDWKGYSLDNTANKTILGNKTISMPRNGSHTIQVFGNDSLGDMFQSEKRYFTTHYNSIDIITPENITYTKPMDGYYPGTYGFENDQNGDIPEGWVDTTGTGYTIEVIDEKYGHRKVVELKDNHGSNYPLMVNYFSSSRIIGTIEFWIATTNKDKATYLSFRDSADRIAFQVQIESSLLRFLYHDSKYIDYIIENQKWYHIRIDFNCLTHQMTYWLDQINIGPDLSFYDLDADYITRVLINTHGIDSAYSSYIDAIGYSWDSHYSVGDNNDEGILLSCDNFTNLEWRDFSLDGQTRQSILGNKTLPTPVDGTHSIQFFAQDSLGEYYESEIRYFTIEIAPSVEWISPGDGSTVILPYTKPPNENEGLFTFQYTYRKLDDIELEIDGVNLGSVWNATSIVLTPYTDYINGFFSATLIGINNSVIVDTDTRSFQFVKIVNETTEILNSSTQILGKQLYLILHDPHGDNSFSSISESTKLSLGVGCEITTAIGFSVEVSAKFKLFGLNMEASVLLEAKATLSQEYDFRYEITDTTSLTSGQATDDADYIGPGYGDRYWGESWIYKWVLNGTYREYSNGTDRWEKPKLYYGIIRGVETFASDEHAPAEWRDQNAVYNDTFPVSWITLFQESGGATYNYEHEVSTTSTRKISFQIELGADFGLKFEPVETHITIELSVKNYAEFVEGNTYKVAYEIKDDDPSDFVVQHIGIDERFGTFIFKSEPFFCETSDPLEHNSYDYLPPVIDFPTIDFDTNNDDFGPANDDSPLVRVNIFEEGDLQNVAINYTINNGLNWNLIYLDEIIASPGIWEGTIPSLTQGTKVKWYIIAWDSQGNRAERKDIYGNPFEYTVLEKPLVHSYPLILIILSPTIPIITFLLRYRKKLKKINT